MLKHSLLHCLSLLAITQVCNARAVEKEIRAPAGPVLESFRRSIFRYAATPALCLGRPNRTDVFVRGTNNAVYHKWQKRRVWLAWNPSQTSYENLGGVIYGDVTAVSWGPNRLDLLSLGTDDAVYHKWWDGSSWGGWESLGGTAIGEISAVSWGPNKTGPIRPRHEQRSPPQGLERRLLELVGWYNQGGVIVDDVTPVSTASNRLDLFARGTDNALYQKSWNGGAWTAWIDLGGRIVSRPSAAAWGGKYITVAAQGTDNAVYLKEFNGHSWADWRSIGGVVTDAPVINPRGGFGPQSLQEGQTLPCSRTSRSENVCPGFVAAVDFA
ncbi:hypothetical protein J3459_011523 [Metarhizium acridum]|nr:hypothetical protein J3459_011523 [Metarhizium acridum]